MKSIEFVKMEGAGNDFVVVDLRKVDLSLESLIDLTPELCDRKFGVGADGLLALSPADMDEVDYTMIYRNADGSDAGMCGNGSRCLSLFAALNDFDLNQSFNVHDQIYQAKVNPDKGEVMVSFPAVLAPKKLKIDKIPFVQVYPGTEHVVTFVESETLDEEEHLFVEGHSIRNHPLLNPPGTNVNFVFVADTNDIDLQTYERGVEDLTLACGTGAIASAIATHFIHDGVEGSRTCSVQVKGGLLEVGYNFVKERNRYERVTLKGPARIVFQGVYEIP